MLQLSRLRTIIGVVVIGLVISIPSVNAKVKPTHALLFGWSDVVLVGQLQNISSSKAGYTVYVDVKKFLRASYAVRKMRRLSFYYPTMDMHSINVLQLKQQGGDYLMFLRFDPGIGQGDSDLAAFNLRLTDAWYGIEKADTRISNQLVEFEQRLFSFVQREQ